MSEQQQATAVVPVTKSEFVAEVEKTFAVADLAALVVAVSNISGSIAVEAWDQPTVHIRAVKRARSQRSFDRTHVELSQDGSVVKARTRIDEDAVLAGVIDLLRGDRAGATVEYTVHMPAAGLLRARNVNGAIVVSGLTNRSEVSAVNGGVTLANLGGETDAGTVNGSLKASGLAGAAKLNTVNGSLDLAAAALARLDARTVSGSIRAALSIAADGRYEFNTTNGDCDLMLPAATRCTLGMDSVNGGVECALPHTTLSSEMRPAFSSWQGAINGGGAPVNVRTVNGRLRVRPSAGDAPAGSAAKSAASEGSAGPSHGDAPAGSAAKSAASERSAVPSHGDAPGGAAAQSAAPARPAERSMDAGPAAPATKSDEPARSSERSTMDILRAVERGELTVDDAMKAMAAKPKVGDASGEAFSS